ncbi:hypothetical protein RRG08_029810 [Elysia crispata]|uniref:Uncharacterized protein n=1 Tax=Elysia crispata TaxID=231223 RepID=A0AAE0YLW6_9GAST|nr:hypothetical protein RRG08_029810 [Elysia crispata]
MPSLIGPHPDMNSHDYDRGGPAQINGINGGFDYSRDDFGSDSVKLSSEQGRDSLSVSITLATAHRIRYMCPSRGDQIHGTASRKSNQSSDYELVGHLNGAALSGGEEEDFGLKHIHCVDLFTFTKTLGAPFTLD